jgi:hypothetical protein
MIDAAEELEREAARSVVLAQRIGAGQVTVAVDAIDNGGARAQQRLEGLILLHEARARLFRRCAASAEQMGAPWYVPDAARSGEGWPT